MENTTETIILGIDPGTNLMGYGIISVKNKKTNLLNYGIIYLKKFNDHYIKLKNIFEKTIFLIDEYKPDEISIEAPFQGVNPQSMLKLGRAQGVAMTAGLIRQIPIFEYSPRKIKQSVTGNGAAKKEQVAFMLEKLLNFKSETKHLDATDAIAAAMCHFYNRNSQKTNTKNSWESFLKNNPDRIK